MLIIPYHLLYANNRFWWIYDTVDDESRKKMEYSATRSPARLGNRHRETLLLWTPGVRFSCFVPCFLLFLFSPSLSRYVYLLRVPSSVQQSCVTLSKHVVRVLLVSFVSSLISECLSFFV